MIVAWPMRVASETTGKISTEKLNCDKSNRVVEVGHVLTTWNRIHQYQLPIKFLHVSPLDRIWPLYTSELDRQFAAIVSHGLLLLVMFPNPANDSPVAGIRTFNVCNNKIAVMQLAPILWYARDHLQLLRRENEWRRIANWNHYTSVFNPGRP